MSSLLKEKFGYLLVSIERQFEQPNMMPHSVSFEDAIKFFGKPIFIQSRYLSKKIVFVTCLGNALKKSHIY